MTMRFGKRRRAARLRAVPAAALVVALGLGLAGADEPPAPAGGPAVVIDIEGGIGAATAQFVSSALEQAAERDAALVVIRMDTPGGLQASMRDIIKEILGSRVPVATWVGPDGARAASAGAVILIASHVAAMAPVSNLGSATPVSITGSGPREPSGTPPRRPGRMPSDLPGTASPADAPGESGETGSAGEENGDAAPADGESGADAPDTAMDRKVLNDAIAYIRSLAERRGRNAEWAESAVREAANITAAEALELNVIDFIAEDLQGVLEQADGLSVETPGGEITLATAGRAIETIEPNWRQRFLAVITNPNVTVLLMLAGIYGLIFEGWNPGAIVPGVVGAICLLLAAYALQLMPVNYVGLGLIVLGLALMTAEFFVPSFGALGLGGVVAFVIGAIIMFDTDVPGFGVSLWFVGVIAALVAASILWLIGFLLRLRKRGAVSGTELMEKDIAVAKEDFDREGYVWLEGEQWQARSRYPVSEGQKLRVLHVDGLVLEVEPLDEPLTGGEEPAG